MISTYWRSFRFWLADLFLGLVGFILGEDGELPPEKEEPKAEPPAIDHPKQVQCALVDTGLRYRIIPVEEVRAVVQACADYRTNAWGSSELN